MITDISIDIFIHHICPYLTGKIIDIFYTSSQQYNALIKDNIKYLYKYYWKSVDIFYNSGKLLMRELYKDGLQEGNQYTWTEDGVVESVYMYNNGELIHNI